MTRAVFALLAACACPQMAAAPDVGKPPVANGSGTPSTCAGVRGKIEQLYRAEAQQKEPKRVEEAMADNTAMVMNDCKKDETNIAACIDKAQNVAEMEKCLPPLDEEGSEGVVR